jgi:hypothetical protein
MDFIAIEVIISLGSLSLGSSILKVIAILVNFIVAAIKLYYFNYFIFIACH